MVLFYRNSILASVISVLSCALSAGGLMLCFSGDLGLGIPFILLGLPGVLGARILNDNKEFKKWWENTVGPELAQEVSQSREAAIALYNQNPQRRTIRKIAELNPEAAAHIEQRIKELMAQRRSR